MKTVGAGSSAGVWLDYFEDAPLCSQGRPMATSVDVFAEAPAQIRLGAADETKKYRRACGISSGAMDSDIDGFDTDRYAEFSDI